MTKLSQANRAHVLAKGLALNKIGHTAPEAGKGAVPSPSTDKIINQSRPTVPIEDQVVGVMQRERARRDADGIGDR
jgi:hypothetical protein